MSKIKLSETFIKDRVKLALAEDLYPNGDITTDLLNKNEIITAKLISNQRAIVAGLLFTKHTFSQVDKIITKYDVKIISDKNILNKLPVTASNLYAKNLFNFVLNLYDKKNKKININLEDEIIKKTLLK